MDPDRHCLDEAAPPGSSLYYATLFAGTRERRATVSIHALRCTLLGIVESIADPSVRARKLNWWSGEILEARDGRARHPVTVAVTRHCGAPVWRRPDVLSMLCAIGRLSSACGFESVAARDEFCSDVGGGTARLCATALAFDCSEAASNRIGALGTALERAAMAAFPVVRSGLARIPDSTSGAPPRPGGVDPDDFARRVAEERSRARRVLADAFDEALPRAGPTMLVYRTLARIQLAAMASALREPLRSPPSPVSIMPIRKLWIAWRTARGDR